MVRCLRCEYGDCYDAATSQECISTTHCFTSTGWESYETHGKEVIVHKRGCDDTGLACHFTNNLKEMMSSRVRMDCCSTDLCNNGTFPKLPSAAYNDLPQSNNYNNTLPPHSLFIFFGIFLFLTISFFIFVYIYKRCSNKKSSLDAKRSYAENVDVEENEYLNSNDYRPEVKVTCPGDSTLREALVDGEVSSGSGSGFPLLIQRTLAKEIKLDVCIGQGRYGEVWRGVYHCDKVAVKIFYSRDEASFQREVEIYSIILMKNENILPFIGSDVTSVNSCTQLWLVTTYYPLGSLFDYLSVNSLNLKSMFSILNSITSGIAHLHIEVFGVQGKPAIAHRDIKSKNILMKDANTCCIADFGLAVTHKQTTDSLNIAHNYRVGTKRYCAPELLDESMKSDHFESYRNADIYSLGLVFWEVYNRLAIDGHVNEYAVPYQNDVPSDPSFEDMRQVVCVKQLRPQFTVPSIPEDDNTSLLLASIRHLIAECWKEKPGSRLSAQHIKKKIAILKPN